MNAKKVILSVFAMFCFSNASALQKQSESSDLLATENSLFFKEQLHELRSNERKPKERSFLKVRDLPPVRSSLFSTPQDWMVRGLQALEEAELNLLSWIRHRSIAALNFEDYNRQKHFGSWINDPNDETCQNTRAKVLIRDSKEPVKFKTTEACAVESGLWKDPYSGLEFTKAEDVQVDHMIPLKNAYLSGAWKWDDSKRCLFANFTANKFHLITASGHENQSKSDRTPEEYLPSNKRYVCTYLKNWLKIKLIWALELTREEGAAVRTAVEDYGCDPATFQFRHSDLLKQRVATEEMQILCQSSKNLELNRVQ